MSATCPKTTAISLAFLALLTVGEAAVDWKRSTLVYHKDSGRSTEEWKRNFMRINPDGSYNGQWLWDHAIIGVSKIDGQDIMYGGLQGSHFKNMFAVMTDDLANVENALSQLTPSFPLAKKITVSLTVPYIDNQDRWVTIDNVQYHLSEPNDRRALVSWYVGKIKEVRDNIAYYQTIQVDSAYYHREDIVDTLDDVAIVQYFNDRVHAQGLTSVWVPYYNAPYNWEGTQLGFDVVVIQPGYSYMSTIDRGSINGARLYSLGYKSAYKKMCYEYELRGGGRDQIENWIAHQYLAIAQFTGAWAYPQVFFFGQDWLDNLVSQSESLGDQWWAYSDLANYLAGQQISNLEVGIHFSQQDHYRQATDSIYTTWTVPPGFDGISSIRLDFNDEAGGYWRGWMMVTTSSAVTRSGKIGSYSYRSGPDRLNIYYSNVLVPLANLNITVGQQLEIELFREPGSEFPNIMRLIGAKYEPPQIATGIYGERSFGSKFEDKGPYMDNANTHQGYAKGKLTDGEVSEWNWVFEGKVGWYLIPEGILTITIDMESIVSDIKTVRIWTHEASEAAVGLITRLTTAVSTTCAPKLRGTDTLGCRPQATTVGVREVRSQGDKYALEMDFSSPVSARYVSVTGMPRGWCMADEIQVLSSSGAVLSLGKPYTVNPIPGDHSPAVARDGGGTGSLMTDGGVFRRYAYGTTGVVQMNETDGGGNIQVSWEHPKDVRCFRVWMTETGPYNDKLPDSVAMQLKDEFNNWSGMEYFATQQSCGPAPCAYKCFPTTKRLTGGIIFYYNLVNWTFTSEISVE